MPATCATCQRRRLAQIRHGVDGCTQDGLTEHQRAQAMRHIRAGRDGDGGGVDCPVHQPLGSQP